MKQISPYIWRKKIGLVVNTAKLRLTGLVAANAVEEKLPLFVIGKSKKPRCFKHIKHLPCRYRSQKKSWMDSILFEEGFMKLTDALSKKNKKMFCWLIIVQSTHPLITSYLLNKYFCRLTPPQSFSRWFNSIIESPL